jgi:hypothetical protein
MRSRGPIVGLLVAVLAGPAAGCTSHVRGHPVAPTATITATTTTTGTVTITATATVTATTTVVFPPGAPPQRVLDSGVEQTIEQGGYTNVSCPDEPVQAGHTFICTDDGGRRFKVTIVDDKGDFTWIPVR